MNWFKVFLWPFGKMMQMPALIRRTVATPQSVLKKAAEIQNNFGVDFYHDVNHILSTVNSKHGGKINVNVQDENGNTLLHYLGGRIHDLWRHSYAQILLSYKADANILNKNGETPLKFLASKLYIPKQKDEASYQTESFFYPKDLARATALEHFNRISADGHTILTDVAKNNPFISPQLIDTLVKDGCDPNICNKEGKTFLHILLENIADNRPVSHIYQITNLTKYRQAVAAYNKSLVETFYYCLKKYDSCISPSFKQRAKEIVEKSCTLPSKNDNQAAKRAALLAALAVDEQERLPEVNLLLHQLAADTDFTCFKGVDAENELREAAFDKIILLATDIDEKNEQEQTPLQVAIEKNNTEFAFLLLKNGADIHTEDNAGNTLLHTAAKAKCAPILSYLLAKNELDANAPNHRGETPLSLTKGDQMTSMALLTGHADFNPSKHAKLVFDFEELTSKQVADMLSSKKGLEVARKTKKLRPAMEYMEHKDRMRAYVHIIKQLTDKEKQDVEEIIRHGTNQTPQKVACAPAINQKPENQKTME